MSEDYLLIGEFRSLELSFILRGLGIKLLLESLELNLEVPNLVLL